uniref:Uncharacterized protein n=1 Tax=Cucumis melo TaxID=3656 RepID=A0A9I9EL87_CUCME
FSSPSITWLSSRQEGNGSKQPNTGLFVGLNKGHIVRKKELAPLPTHPRGKSSKIVLFVGSLICEVVGFAHTRRE